MASAYTLDQVAEYERYIGLPPLFHHASKPALDLEYLKALQTYQIAAVPYENLVLHYSSHHSVNLDPQVIFRKIVEDRRGRGGYCMENSIFLNHILRALGFQVYTAGVKIRPRDGGVPKGDYIGWVHIVNIVTLPDGSKYSLDVGFGGDGQTLPLPLDPSPKPPIFKNLGNQQVRLIHGTIPQQVDQSKKVWIYQYRNLKPGSGDGVGSEPGEASLNNETPEWNSFYCFPEVEFTEADFSIMNYYTSTSQGTTNFQTRTVLVVRFLKGEVGDGEKKGIVGKVMLVNGEVKRNDGGKTRIEKICKNERERVEVLKSVFGIDLTEEEVEGIKGRNVELLNT